MRSFSTSLLAFALVASTASAEGTGASTATPKKPTEKTPSPIEAADKLVRQTKYEKATEALAKIKTDQGKLLLARVQLETGLDDLAEKTAKSAAASDARTLFLTKVAMKHGRYDEAERALQALAIMTSPLGRRARLIRASVPDLSFTACETAKVSFRPFQSTCTRRTSKPSRNRAGASFPLTSGIRSLGTLFSSG